MLTLLDQNGWQRNETASASEAILPRDYRTMSAAKLRRLAQRRHCGEQPEQCIHDDLPRRSQPDQAISKRVTGEERV